MNAPHAHPLTPADFRPVVLEHRDRRAGILLHPTSLPSPGAVGSLGVEAERFLEFLASAGQTLWQVMPLGPIGLGNSPYATTAVFAGNPLLISQERLVERGWLAQPEHPHAPGDRSTVDFALAAVSTEAALRRARHGFLDHAEPAERAAFEAFNETQRYWLDDFALFMALKAARGYSAWFQWEERLRRREPSALDAARRELADEIHFHALCQFFFFQQWHALKQIAGARGIRIIGDIPIFVAHDSADVWSHQDIFTLDAEGRASVVSGVPPDLFSATGQRWGNPLYRWDRLAERGYDWWIQRFAGALQLVDLIRLDHFRGFEAYWEVPGDQETAEHGRWVPGPGAALFDAVCAALGELPLFVEDLGVITEAVELLRRRLGYPGMKVLQFAFADDANNPYLPHNYQPGCVVYTGTHDNDTTIGWYSSASELERHQVRAYLGVDGHDIAWDLIRCALASVADTAIVPLQDILGLDGHARMNLPGDPHGNWRWRYRAEQLEPRHAERLAELTGTYGRLPADNKSQPA